MRAGMAAFAAIDELLVDLRRMLSAALPHVSLERPPSMTLISRLTGRGGVALEDILARDAASGASPSLLFLASVAGHEDTQRALLGAGARLQEGEDVFSSLVNVASALQRSSPHVDPDTWLRHALAPLRSAGLRTCCASSATLTCFQSGWFASTSLMLDVDPFSLDVVRTQASHSVATLQAAVEGSPAQHAASKAAARILDAAAGQVDRCHQAAQRMLRRAALIEAVQMHITGGTLPTLARHLNEVAFLPRFLANFGDMDMSYSLIRAGVVVVGDADIYHAFLSTLRKSDIQMEDNEIVTHLRRLHTATNCTHARAAASSCVFRGLVACMRFLVEIDPGALNDASLLHLAANAHKASMCSYLIEAGLDILKIDSFGYSPLGLCLQPHSASPDLDALCSTLEALLDGFDDITAAVTMSAVCSLEYTFLFAMQPFQKVPHARLLLHVYAAVRLHPAGPSVVLTCSEMNSLRAPAICTFRREALDVHSNDGIYIPDQLRAGVNPSALAVHVDAVHDVQKHLLATEDDRPPPEVWRTFVLPGVAFGVSGTLQAWAYMRRLHAIIGRMRRLRRFAQRNHARVAS